MSYIKYSIIIPTCNKNLTKKCLEYLSKIRKPIEKYEVLVIHNVTKNDIKSVTDNFLDKIPNLKYFYEENYGLMPSRHRGAYEANGEILCYIDDDSFVNKNWLIGIEETFKDNNVVLAGGNNIPLYECKPPKWLKYFWLNEDYGKWMGQLSLINFRKRKMKLPAWFAFGCNFAIKKSIFFEVGGTNPDTTPKNKQRFQGDGETALSLKLNEKGFILNFNPKITINHFVPKLRMENDYFKNRAYFVGVFDSFSQIRKKNGFSYYDYTPNNNVDKFNKKLLIKNKYNKIIKILNKKLNRKNYRTYLDIKDTYYKAYQEGFDFHQNEVKNDPDLLKWVLKDNYI